MIMMLMEGQMILAHAMLSTEALDSVDGAAVTGKPGCCMWWAAAFTVGTKEHGSSHNTGTSIHPSNT